MSVFPLAEAQEALFSRAVERLLAIPEESSRRLFLHQNPQFQNHNVVFYLASQVPKMARSDADRALQLAALAGWLAEILDDDYCRARSARALGHPLQLKGKLHESLVEYEKALTLFTKLKLESEVGITLSGSLQPLILLGNYEEARRREEEARKIFKAQGDELRLARLDANLGNILHRQDRFEEALVLYQRAEEALQRFHAADDLAIVLNNMAVCHISLREFCSALEAYKRLRTYSEQRRLRLLTAQADYNIAYLHYLQGEYDRAIDLYKKTRIFCAQAGDPYHAALCDVDQAEICLQMELFRECKQLAQDSLDQFQGLKMNYETGKAYALLALVACHETDAGHSLELFAKARELFLVEQNWIWLALIDFYRAIALSLAGRWSEALLTVSTAQSVLSHSTLKDKAALAELLRSLLHVELGDRTAAQYWGESALKRINSSGMTEIQHVAEFVLGRIAESQNDLSGADHYYERAKSLLESGAGHGRQERIRPSLLKKPDTVYGHLLSAALSIPSPAMTQKQHKSQ
jgi:tetratricopeptide (TPR) repeat protein